MTQHDQQSSGVEAAANVQPSAGRRRWVKGAVLATPAVMTLMSGRLASASSHQCDPTEESPNKSCSASLSNTTNVQQLN
ncbi:MAG: hypothetical protein IPL99_02790 [Candidatus Competibacteraceae bacterium]|nr:hypothetical protein [Candidatus Competibacteraceae bacterium]